MVRTTATPVRRKRRRTSLTTTTTTTKSGSCPSCSRTPCLATAATESPTSTETPRLMFLRFHKRRQRQRQPKALLLLFQGVALFLLLVFLAVLLPFVAAFPTGAGSCPQGRAAVGGTHLTNAILPGSGRSLESQGFYTSVNEARLDRNSMFTLPTTTSTTTHTLSLGRTTSNFKGYAIVVGSNDTDAAALDAPPILTILNATQDQIKTDILCPSPETTALATHKDNRWKQSVELSMTLPASSLDRIYILDVTIVIQNVNAVSSYVYSQYRLLQPASSTSTNTSSTNTNTTAMSINTNPRQCKLYLIMADANANTVLEYGDEYTTFLNKMMSMSPSVLWGDDEWTVDTLPQELTLLFEEYATGSGSTGNMSILGAKPGSTATLEQLVHLDNFCQEVVTVLEVLLLTTGTTTTAAPGDAEDSVGNKNNTATATSTTTILDLISAQDNFQLFASAISSLDGRSSNISSRFQQDTTATTTWFVPVNDAFLGLVHNQDTTNNAARRLRIILTNENHLWDWHLQDFILYHALASSSATSGGLSYEDLTNQVSPAALSMANGEIANVTTIPTFAPPPMVQVNGDATIINTDFSLQAPNGMAHAIDKVLLPSSIQYDIIDAMIMGQAPQQPFSIFLDLLILAELDESLRTNDIPTTLFVPTNDAFSRLKPDELEYLQQPQNKDLLVDVLTNHMTLGILQPSNLLLQQPYPQQPYPLAMVNGKATALSFTEEAEGVFQIDSSTRTTSLPAATFRETDRILSNNGIIYVIDTVLIPVAHTAITTTALLAANNESDSSNSTILSISAAIPTGSSNDKEEEEEKARDNVSIGEPICRAGYIMDEYCIDRGTLMDNPAYLTLGNPEEHSLHCLLDVSLCYESPYHILDDPQTGSNNSTMYGPGWAVSNNTLLIHAGRMIGSCATCDATGTRVKGLRMEIVGTVKTLDPPVIEVEDVLVLEAGQQGCIKSLFDTEANSVWDLINDQANMVIFRDSLQIVNMDKLLVDNAISFTVFAPTDDVITQYDQILHYKDNIGNWNGHLTTLLENHVIQGLSLPQAELFSGGLESITSFAGNQIAVDSGAVSGQPSVGGEVLSMPDFLAANGVVHALGGVLLNDQSSFSLMELLSNGIGAPAPAKRRLQSGSGYVFNTLVQLLEENSRTTEDALVQISNNGTTVVAPSDTAFAAELVDTDSTSELLLYHILERNIYKDDFNNTSQLLVPTKHPTGAHVWLTVDDHALMRYNGAEVQVEALGRNGVIHVVDNILQPPGMLKLLNYTAAYTSLDVKLMHDLLSASGWGANGSKALLNPDGSAIVLEDPVTFFVPIGAESLFKGEAKRLMEPLWKRHLHQVLQELMLPLVYTKEELQQTAEADGFRAKVETVGQTNLDLAMFSTGLAVAGGKFQGQQMRATDGLIHLVDYITLAPSVKASVFNLMFSFFQLSRFSNSIAKSASDLFDLANNYSPLTIFAPVDSAWGAPVPPDKMEDLLRDHMFHGLFFSDQLLQMDGQVITSLNNKTWVIKRIDESIWLEKSDAQTGDEGGNFSVELLLRDPLDVLGRNGLFHSIGALLLDDTDMPRKCRPCGRSQIVQNTLPDMITCDEWIFGARNSAEDSEQCMLEISAGSQFCGCPPPPAAEPCDICFGQSLDQTIPLPDARGLTCASLEGIVGDAATCNLLREKYSSHCGCSDNSEPSCSFCETGAALSLNRSYPLPLRLAEAEPNVYGDISDLNCGRLAALYSVQSNASCGAIGSNLFGESEFDLKAWCGCPGFPAPDVCGDFCPEGTAVSNTTRDNMPADAIGLTCGELVEAVKYIYDAATCGLYRGFADSIAAACCESLLVSTSQMVEPPGIPDISSDSTPSPNGSSESTISPNGTVVVPPPWLVNSTTSEPTTKAVVRMNVSFVIFNTDGLASQDVQKVDNAAKLRQSLETFVRSLVSETENLTKQLPLQRQRFLRLRSVFSGPRRLEVSLQPGSAAIFQVEDIPCPSTTANGTSIPTGANCQSVLGQYDLALSDEDQKAVIEKYSNATETAIEQGKLDYALKGIDRSTPFSVAGPVVTADNDSEAENSAVGNGNINIIDLSESGDTNQWPTGNDEKPKEGSKEDKKMKWWVILLIVLAAVLCVCLLVGLPLMRKKPKEDEPDAASVKLLEEDSDTKFPSAVPPVPTTVAPESFDDEEDRAEDGERCPMRSYQDGHGPSKDQESVVDVLDEDQWASEEDEDEEESPKRNPDDTATDDGEDGTTSGGEIDNKPIKSPERTVECESDDDGDESDSGTPSGPPVVPTPRGPSTNLFAAKGEELASSEEEDEHSRLASASSVDALHAKHAEAETKDDVSNVLEYSDDGEEDSLAVEDSARTAATDAAGVNHKQVVSEDEWEDEDDD